jgi:hypothetical protein
LNFFCAAKKEHRQNLSQQIKKMIKLFNINLLFKKLSRASGMIDLDMNQKVIAAV